MICDRCKKEIPLIKPINTCNVINSNTYDWCTYVLCNDCAEELHEFLGGKKIDKPRSLEFWYSNIKGSGTDA